MKKIITFGNNGPLDPRLWSTFGVSVKESGDAIGQFGTGLKYAIAILMRESRSCRIVSGDQEYVFGVEGASIRGKEFKQVTCNGEPLPFTTHLGSHWKLWQAYRELYSNCLDEGGDIDFDGETKIFAEIGDVDHHEVFLDTSNYQLAASGPNCDIYYGSSNCIYYRGIRVYETQCTARYTYNLKSASLTEDRTLRFPHQLDEYSSQTVLESNNSSFLIDFMTQTKGAMEENIIFQLALTPPSDAAIEVFQQLRRKNCYLQEGLAKKLKSFAGPEDYEFADFSSRQEQIIGKAKDFCAKIGYPIAYPIKLAIDLPETALAMANRKTNEIYLSNRVLTMGVKQVASTLLEENIHLALGLDDCTYAMQTYLFDQIITMGEELTGEVI